MNAKLTRREAGLLVAAASTLAAQTKPSDQNPATAVTEARRDISAALAKFKLSLFTEPAFEFRP